MAVTDPCWPSRSAASSRSSSMRSFALDRRVEENTVAATANSRSHHRHSGIVAGLVHKRQAALTNEHFSVNSHCHKSISMRTDHGFSRKTTPEIELSADFSTSFGTARRRPPASREAVAEGRRLFALQHSLNLNFGERPASENFILPIDCRGAISGPSRDYALAEIQWTIESWDQSVIPLPL